MQKLQKFLRYFKDFLQFGQFRLVIGAIIFLLTGKSILNTRICRGKLGYFLHRKGTLDFQFGNYAYEWAVKQFMLSHYKDFSVFVDIGSNMGTYTLLLQQLGLKSYAFEPSHSNYKALTINLMLNNLENLTKTYNVGLASKASREKFVFDPINTGASHLNSVEFYDHVTDNRGTIDEIELVMLDEMIDKMGIATNERILMKIDVEGMEKDVLLGASTFIKTYPNILIVMESVHSGEQALKEVLNQMAEFQYFEIDHLNFAAKKVRNL